ncbi:hypothetical protein DPEC_G00314670 [Dallia pectoralis]|uniref:Uncharacterized protein n=1 Tax=Dallia pectoralis TaxID=75939 RepID=A0ACC2FC88_DALPE|nr:hypothetical protein DPEC_G00314670 [Dallia pectoralis]
MRLQLLHWVVVMSTHVAVRPPAVLIRCITVCCAVLDCAFKGKEGRGVFSASLADGTRFNVSFRGKHRHLLVG